MLDSNEEMLKEFKAMIGLQIGTLITYILVGGVIAVVSYQHILNALPASEWSPIIGMILAGVFGYVVGGMIVGILVLILFLWIVSQ